MPDFFVENFAADRVALSPEDSHHALRVLRLKPGQVIHVSGEGKRYEALLEVENGEATARITRQLPSTEARTRITLYQGWPKGDKMDLIVRQATELGVFEVVPCLFERCVAKPDGSGKKIGRLNRIAREAAMQSGRTFIPRVAETMSFQAVKTRLQQHELALLPYEMAREDTIPNAYQNQTDVAIVIGPEGGFTQSEVEALSARAVTLGRRILRTETAGVAAMAMLLATARDF